MKRHKLDLIIISILIIAAGISWLVINILSGSKGDHVEIMKGSAIEKIIPLGTDGEYEIKSDDLVNIVRIKNGQVWMEEANCPDRLCVKQGKIDKNGQSIICLPHKITVKIVSGGDASVDAHKK